MMKEQIMGALKYAVKMLEKEWERSGQTKKVLETDVMEIRSVLSKIRKESVGSGRAADGIAELSFRESLTISKRNYILLRLARKLTKALEKAERKGTVFCRVEADKEEAVMWRQFTGEQE